MQKDAAYMKLIEEISLNAWPSHKIELYDGWLIRFSHNYTYRTNSVEQVGDSLIPIEEKIAYCEAQYRNYHTPSISRSIRFWIRLLISFWKKKAMRSAILPRL